MGKNINQDKILNLKRYVEDYQKQANSLTDLPTKPDQHGHNQEGRRIKSNIISFTDLKMDYYTDKNRPLQMFKQKFLILLTPKGRFWLIALEIVWMMFHWTLNLLSV